MSRFYAASGVISNTGSGQRISVLSNGRFLRAARALQQGERFPALIVAGPCRDNLVCLEGHLRLTAYALAGFSTEVECLVGTDRTMGRWAANHQG
jgi:hypothetical protein